MTNRATTAERTPEGRGKRSARKAGRSGLSGRLDRLEEMVELLLRALLRGRLLPLERKRIKQHLEKPRRVKRVEADRTRGPRCPACRSPLASTRVKRCPWCSVLIGAARGAGTRKGRPRSADSKKR